MANLMNKGKPDLFDEFIFRRAEGFDIFFKKVDSIGEGRLNIKENRLSADILCPERVQESLSA